LKKQLWIVVLVLIWASAAIAQQPVNLSDYARFAKPHQVHPNGRVQDGQYIHGIIGAWDQIIETDVGTFKIIFNNVEDPWRVKQSPGWIETTFTTQGLYVLQVDLLEDMPMQEVTTPAGKVTFNFDNKFKWLKKTETEGHWTMYAHIGRCEKPIEDFRMYTVIKPPIKNTYFRRYARYNFIIKNLRQDIFLDKVTALAEWKKERDKDYVLSLKPMPDYEIAAVQADKDNNGILDRFQFDKNNYEGLIIHQGPKYFQDSDGDSITDTYQRFYFYARKGMTNFLDINGDGLCDNYSPGVYNKDKQIAFYQNVSVDLRKDMFQNRDTAVAWRGVYYDVNRDGINDIFQQDIITPGTKTRIPFVDRNNDTIHDLWQGMQGYQALGMTNFVDNDGDGLCDNYLR